MQEPAQALRVLDWDSAFFGRRIARLDAPADPAALPDLLRKADAQAVECCYLLCPASNQALLSQATRSGFGLVDIRLLLERPLPRNNPGRSPLTTGYRIREAVAEDLPALEALAPRLHTNTRFFTDPRFGRQAAAALYARWVRRDFSDPDTRFLVLATASEPAGYATVACREGTADIGLFGIDTPVQGRGLGGALLDALLAAAEDRACTRARVVTQGASVPAQRLYQKAGFITASVDLWLHRWNAPAP